jgi:hypothetical protein
MDYITKNIILKMLNFKNIIFVSTVGGKMVRVFSKILQKKEYTGNYESYQRQTSFIRKHKLLLMHFLNFALIG